MKKRIVCVLLTLIMLLSLVPMGASAASHTTSAAAITVLKQMTSFKDKCYYFTGEEFRTGYGTVCEEKHAFDKDGNPVNKTEVIDGKEVKYFDHTITEKKADTALRAVLAELDKKVNSFASANGNDGLCHCIICKVESALHVVGNFTAQFGKTFVGGIVSVAFFK